MERACDLDLSYLLDLYLLQDGKCAATGIVMTYRFGDLRCMSIDRIDSTKDYFKGNVQLVC